ncbi:uncharacterized protein EI90DRAFT_3080714 [Cantharellus anzutake]|uniref:uncharacterized protein n=1 Tax=Cantharellus anzutake TaxID=1750568 RepID=UPI00190421E7|nr:uncharacterized protein EI90DRAFT_3080714 [Cantharellus anzutake]KAF8320589.1 hypothetical protein EI90DRAFT_3080714 [Cantharellus anzutake]
MQRRRTMPRQRTHVTIDAPGPGPSAEKRHQERIEQYQSHWHELTMDLPQQLSRRHSELLGLPQSLSPSGIDRMFQMK